MKKLISLLFLAGLAHATCDSSLKPTYTTRAGIAVPQINSCGWGTATNLDWGIVDSSAAFLATPNTFTSSITFTNPLIIQNNQHLQFNDASSHAVTIRSSQTVANTNFVLPAADGTSGQFMRTDGTGNLSFGSAPGAVSTLGVSQSSVSVSTPTAALNFIGPPFSLTLTGGNTAQVNLDVSSVTLQGNTFNGTNQLVKLDSSSRLPVVDGSQLTNLSVSGVKIYPATGTPSFPFGFSASTGVFSNNVDITGHTRTRAGKSLAVYGSGDVVASTITNPAAALSQMRIDATSGVGINLAPVAGQDLTISTVVASSVSVNTALNLNYVTGTQCLHTVNGVTSGTGSDCGSGGGGGGSSSLAVTTGTSAGAFNTIISSPTGALVVNPAQFLVTNPALTTAYMTLDPSSVTLRGYSWSTTVDSTTATFKTRLDNLDTSTNTLTTRLVAVGVSTAAIAVSTGAINTDLQLWKSVTRSSFTTVATDTTTLYSGTIHNNSGTPQTASESITGTINTNTEYDLNQTRFVWDGGSALHSTVIIGNGAASGTSGFISGITCVGDSSCQNVTNVGARTTGYGNRVLQNIASGSDNACFGDAACQTATTATQMACFGNFACNSANIAGTSGASAFGYNAMPNLSDGASDTCIGHNCFDLMTHGNYNTGSGDTVGGDITTGNSNTCSGSNDGSVQACSGIVTGSSNTATGNGAGGSASQNGDNSGMVFFGFGAKPATGNRIQNSGAIGYLATVASSNTLRLGGTGANTMTVDGSTLTFSSATFSTSVNIPYLTVSQCVQTDSTGKLVSSGGACGGTGGGATLPFPAGATNYINVTSALQSGATFYVSSGTVKNFTAGTGGTVDFFASPTLHSAGAILFNNASDNAAGSVYSNGTSAKKQLTLDASGTSSTSEGISLLAPSVSINGYSPILSTSTLQTGATVYVASATVNTALNLPYLTVSQCVQTDSTGKLVSSGGACGGTGGGGTSSFSTMTVTGNTGNTLDLVIVSTGTGGTQAVKISSAGLFTVQPSVLSSSAVLILSTAGATGLKYDNTPAAPTDFVFTVSSYNTTNLLTVQNNGTVTISTLNFTTDGSSQTVAYTSNTVVFAITTSSSTSLTNFIPTTLTLTITPKLATHRILLTFTGTLFVSNASNSGMVALARNSSVIGNGCSRAVNGAGAETDFPVSCIDVDAPGTTSAVTYTVYIKSGTAGQSVGLVSNGERNVLMAQELP